ncbi:nucleotidyltransferase domain-containing protein, partial [bacterium]|nr:nucleotidyltransferase domain-containing protein [bacterium]
MSEIVRRVGAGRGAVQRELTNLAAAGLLVRSDRGNLTLYEANADCPIYAELRALMVKTAGVLAVLQEALQPLSEAIAVAFVYGSVAAGTQTANSDVDLLVVGDVSFGQVVACLGPAQGQLGREVNPTVYQREEFGRELAAQTHFLRAVMT